MYQVQEKSGKVLSIIAIVLGGIGLLISLIPCVGIFGSIPLVPALILSSIGMIVRFSKKGRLTLPIIALSITLCGAGISAFRFVELKETLDENDKRQHYFDCDELIIEYVLLVSSFEDSSVEVNNVELLALKMKQNQYKKDFPRLECGTDSATLSTFNTLNRKVDEIEARCLKSRRGD